MDNLSLSCTKCSTPLPGTLLISGQPGLCPLCHSSVQTILFPALFKPIARGQFGETILLEGEASCFYHPQKRAVVPCDACGRFLCAVCDVHLNQQHLCPVCLEAGKQKGSLPELETKRVLYDSTALSIALLFTLAGCVWPVWIITAPLAIFFAIFSWFRPSSLIPRTRLRAYAAVLISLLQIAGWFVILFHFVLSP